MPKPLSQGFINIFEENETFFNTLKTDSEFVRAYDVRKHFEDAKDYSVPIEEFRLFYGDNWNNLENKGIRYKAESLYVKMQAAEQAYTEQRREEQRLLLKAVAEERATSWGINAFPTVVAATKKTLNENHISILEYSQPVDKESHVPTVSFDNKYKYGHEDDVQPFHYSAENYQQSYDYDNNEVENELAQKEIELFQQLLQSANLPNFLDALQHNINIQNAIQAKNTFALLQALLEELATQQDNNQAVHLLSKALMTAHLLLNKPVLEEDSNYIQLPKFLLQQVPVNEVLLLEVIKLQIKICLLAGDNLAATQQYLNGFLTFKDSQGKEDIPALSEAFFGELDLLLKDINQYQRQGVEFLDQFKGLNAAKQLFNIPSLNKEEAKQRLAFVRSYTKDLLLVKPVDLQQLPVYSHDDQVTATPKPLQLDDLYKKPVQSEADEAKREFAFKLLEDAKQITTNTKGQSREDLDNLSSLVNDKYYPVEKDDQLRKAFRADLITKAVTGLVFSTENPISLSQYLASARLDSKDKNSYVIRHYRFFLAVIKQHARQQALALVKAGKFAELGELIKNIHGFGQKCASSKLSSVSDLAERFQAEEMAVISTWFNDIQTTEDYAQSIVALSKVSPSLLALPQVSDAVAVAVHKGSRLNKQLKTSEDYQRVILPLLNLLNKDTEAFVTQQVLLLANLDLDKTLQVIKNAKSVKGETALIDKLATTVAIQNLPSFRLLISLYPQAQKLFATPEFAPTMQIVANLALIYEDDIHDPLLQLLKASLLLKEDALVNKTLLVFMTLKKPSEKHYGELKHLLTQHDKEHGTGYLKTLEHLPGIPLNSFNDYQILLQEAVKTDDVNHDLLNRLFEIVLTKAKDAADLLSLAPVCKSDATLTEQLAKALYERFPQIENLKALMKRVDCPEMLAKVIDEKINQEIAKVSARTQDFFQKFFVQANYPHGSVKDRLIQDYFAYCQRQKASDRPKYYAAFIRYLVDQRCLPWFIQSILPQIVQQILVVEMPALAKAEQCGQLLEFIENHLAQEIQSAGFNDLLNQQRSLIGGCWIDQLVACRDQLVLSGEMLAQRQVLYGEEGSKQVFVSVFDVVIQNIQKTEIPSLVELQQANSTVMKLLKEVKDAEKDVAEQYAKLEENYHTDLNSLIQNQELFIQDFDKKLAELNELYQQVIEKKVGIFSTIAQIGETLKESGFNDVEKTCQTYLATVNEQFVEIAEIINSQLEKLTQEKRHQATDLQELTALHANENEQLVSEKMRIFRDKQQIFEQTKKTVNQLVAQTQVHVDTTHKSLLEQTVIFKNNFGQTVTKLYQEIEQAKTQQLMRQDEIVTKKHRQEQIGLDVESCRENLTGVRTNIDLQQQELMQKKNELDKLSAERLTPVSLTIRQLSNTEQFKTSIKNFIDLFKQAIANRRSQQEENSGYTRFRMAVAKFVTDHESSIFIPASFVLWGRAVINDIAFVLPNEIHELEGQLECLERIANNHTALLGAPDEQNKTFAGEIREQIAILFKQDLKIKNDERASWWWRWSANKMLNGFIRDNANLETSCRNLSTTQAQIDGLITTNDTIQQQINLLAEQPQTLTEKIEELNKEKAQLVKDLETLELLQQDDIKNLAILEQQYQQLALLYRRVIPLVSSPLVDIVYCTGLNDSDKLSLLEKSITENKNSLLQDGMGDGIFANILYHIVRHGTSEMLVFILTVLPGEARSRYLITSIIDEGVATTPLALAVKHNDQNKIDCLIKSGANFNQQIFDKDGNETTLLLWAYQHNQHTTVGRLILAGASCAAQDSTGNTLLHWAAMKGDEAMIMRLLNSENSNSVFETKNLQGDDALALLMKSALPAEKKYELMQVLFTRLSAPTRLGGQYFTELDQTGNNFLHHAASKGDLRLVEWVLAQPNSELLNAKNSQGKTALDLAVEAGHLEVVQFLFCQSVALTGIKEVFFAALASAETHEDMIKVFLTNNQISLFSDLKALGDNPQLILRKWTQADQLEIKASSYEYLTHCANLANVKLLVANGADPRATGESDDTVLHRAVLKGDFQRVQYLIEECGVEPHPQNKEGVTPLMALYQNSGLSLPTGSHRQIVDYLIQKTSHNRVVRLLPGQAPETLTQRDGKGNTLLHYVAKMGDVAAVNQLIQQKPYFGENLLDCQNEAGKTAAHLLVENQALPQEVVTTFLGFLSTKGGANLHVEDNEGKTPLEYATYCSVISLLIGKAPEPFQEVKLIPIARRVMASEGMALEQKKEFIEGMARANKMTPFQSACFFRSVSDVYYRSKKPSANVSVVSEKGGLSRIDYMNWLRSQESAQRNREFRLMVIGQKPLEVAWALDSDLVSFPKELNTETESYLSLTDNAVLSTERRNFWVRVVEFREDKRLTLQDDATGNTLLHAIILTEDKGNLYTLNQAGVLYVTERNHASKTVLMLVRDKFLREIVMQPDYLSVSTADQSIYLSVLQSIERRLAFELTLPQLNIEVVKQIMSELDFTQLTEMEMLVSLFAQLDRKGINSEFLWQLTDRNNKTLAEGALSILDQNPSSLRAHRLLVNLLGASQMERRGQSSLGDKLKACREQMQEQITYFAEQSKYNYMLSESTLKRKVLDFGIKFTMPTNKNAISERYQRLCEKSIHLLRPTENNQKNASKRPFLGNIFISATPKENSLSPQQLQENYAYNMTIYLGLFIEAAGIDTLVTLPSRPSESCASLLVVAREKQLPSLYVEIVGRVLTQFNLTNPIELVRQAQSEAAYAHTKFFNNNFKRLHGAFESPQQQPGVSTGSVNGLKITVSS